MSEHAHVHAPHELSESDDRSTARGQRIIELIATFLLVWSMNRHLKKLPKSFDRNHPEPDQAADAGTIGAEPDTTNDKGSTPHEPGG